MKRANIHSLVRQHMTTRLRGLAEAFEEVYNPKQYDAIGIFGELRPPVDLGLRELIENNAEKHGAHENAVIVLDTDGGFAETVERMVKVIRHNYKGEVVFIIPDKAMSAGTLFALSGDKLFMDYYSCLGPTDAQEEDEKGNLISVSGYLRQYEDLNEKSKSAEGITDVEAHLLSKLDLGKLEGYYDSEKFAEALLTEWLLQYQFKNRDISDNQKEEQAKDIAGRLSNNRHWRSHGRMIGMEKLAELQLSVYDFGDKENIKKAITSYFQLTEHYMSAEDEKWMLHHRDEII